MRPRKHKLHIALVLTVSLLGAPTATAATIYVDNQLPNDCQGTYSIANRDCSGSDGDAYKRPQDAADIVNPGDTVYFRAGTYYNHYQTAARYPVMRILRSGTVGNPITFRNYNNEKAIFSGLDAGGSIYKYWTIALGNAPNDQQDVSGQGVQNIIVDGLIVEGASRIGLGIFGPANRYASAQNPTENVIIRNVIARNNGGAGPNGGITSGGKLVNVVIENCEVYNNTGSGIKFSRVSKPWHHPEPEDDMSAAHNSVIRNCLVYNNIHPTRPGDTDGTGGSNMYRCTIENNVVFGNSDDGVDLYASIESTARNNIIFGHSHPGGNNCGLKFAAGGGGRFTIEGNVVFNNDSYSFEGSNPKVQHVGYYPSKIYGNLAYNGDMGFMVGSTYNFSYPGFDKTYLRNNIALDNRGHDIRNARADTTDSDYNFFSNSGDLNAMQNMGLDLNSLTGDPGIVDKTVVIDTNFGADWTIQQKLEHIRSQVREAFSLTSDSQLIDAGIIVDGYHNPDPGEQPGDGKDWYGNAPDIGAYEYGDTCVLYMTAVNGFVTKIPDQSSYSYGETVTLEAVPDTGYLFTSWSGDLFGSDNPTTIIMDSDKSVTANFAMSYTLTVTAVNGSVTKTPNKASYSDGETVTLQAFPNFGYYFVNWSGDLSGSSNPASIIMDSDKSVTANFATGYTLTVTAVNGSVTKTPNKATYSVGETVTLQAFPNTGYDFVNWSGDLSGSSNPASIIMDSDKSVTANFTAASTYSLTITAVNGSVTKTPNKAGYSDGETVTLQAFPNTGYDFVNWSGDLSGSSNPDSIIMDSNKSVTANFAFAAASTYSLTITAVNGSVTKTPNKATYSYGETVALEADPDTGYDFVNWSGDLSGSSNPDSIFMDSDKSVTANFTDETAPSVTDRSPDPLGVMSDLVPLNSLIILDIADTGKGVDRNTVKIRINNGLIYDGDNETSVGVYDSTGVVQTIKGICRRIGSSAAYKYIFQADENFDYDQQLSIEVDATDLAITPNTMSDQYSLISEQHSFGENKILHSGSSNDNWGPLTTVSDSSGNIWIAWPQGVVDSRDIYVGKLTTGTDSFESGGVRQVPIDAHDQSNPVIAIDSSDTLYLAWQQVNQQGDWDIYVSTFDEASFDGTSWPTGLPTEIIDNDPGDDNQTNPAIVIDSSGEVYIVYDDDQNTDKDIYIASSADNYVSKTQITSAGTGAVYDQITPDIAVDYGGTVYVVWADARSWNGNGNPTYDFYGAAAASNDPNPSWNNILIVIEDDQQSNPKIATEAVGTVLHLVWLDDGTPSGDDDIYYATSDGLPLPGSPLTGSSIIDDTTGADQISPVIITTGYTGNDLKVFACWRDERNAEAELYAAEITANGTNIYVGNDFTTDDQSQPAIGIDQYDHPYLVWINGRTDICYAGNTYIEPVPLVASTPVDISSKTTIGTPFGSINDTDDASAEMPQGAYLCDIDVTISRIRNPHKPPSNNRTFLYEFGPSGTTFSEPVTITIPYYASSLVSSPSAYWYNPLTGYSQSGITDVEVIQISSGLYALRFKTTHFSTFGGGGPFGIFGGGGGGGCSVSAGGEGNTVEFVLPYIALAVVMVILKVRDARRRRVRNMTTGKC